MTVFVRCAILTVRWKGRLAWPFEDGSATLMAAKTSLLETFGEFLHHKTAHNLALTSEYRHASTIPAYANTMIALKSHERALTRQLPAGRLQKSTKSTVYLRRNTNVSQMQYRLDLAPAPTIVRLQYIEQEYFSKPPVAMWVSTNV